MTSEEVPININENVLYYLIYTVLVCAVVQSIVIGLFNTDVMNKNETTNNFFSVVLIAIGIAMILLSLYMFIAGNVYVNDTTLIFTLVSFICGIVTLSIPSARFSCINDPLCDGTNNFS